VERLALAPSNVDHFKTGAGVYEHLVRPPAFPLEQVAAHYAMSSLFTDYCKTRPSTATPCASKTIAASGGSACPWRWGRSRSSPTLPARSLHLAFAVLHLGGWDFHCCIRSFHSRLEYTRAKEDGVRHPQRSQCGPDHPGTNDIFGSQSYSLQDLFAEERHRIMRLLSQDTLLRLDQLYSQVYRDNYGVLRAFHRDGLPVPQELQVAADIALSQRTLEVLQSLEQETSDPDGNPLRLGKSISTNWTRSPPKPAISTPTFPCLKPNPC
jgi:alpha-amylase/alpha-mannosidase (GH57 family)